MFALKTIPHHPSRKTNLKNEKKKKINNNYYNLNQNVFCELYTHILSDVEQTTQAFLKQKGR